MSDQNWQLTESDPFGPPTGITRERIAILTVQAWTTCGTHTAVRIAAEEGYATGVADGKAMRNDLLALTDEQYANLRELAFRTLWLAYAWNDHNFDAAHREARTACEALGINSMDDANAFLIALPTDRAAAKGAGGLDGKEPT